MFRSQIVRALRVNVPRASLAKPASRAFSRTAFRLNDGKFPELSEEQIKEVVKNPLINKLAQSPKVLEGLQEVAELLQKKGYNGDMGPMKQIKLMMDSEVRDKMKDLNQLMQDEGIELRQEDMQGLFDIMGIKKE